ncbi:CvpA family protein [Paenibacillus alvei]|uniref:Colicin V production protein n=1 Tax=Paenibacillus alvei TaxID=44250 RepID=A0A383REY9_PAEAL|nr:CvpA family protein [Paenibacillus alvei]SYX85558.1 Colicin V production protein [Paenibacillus alvei]
MMKDIGKFINNVWMEIAAVFASWNGLDYAIVGAAIACIVLGAVRGFKSIALSLFGYIVAFIVAARFYADFIPWVRKRVFTTVSSGSGAEASGGGTPLATTFMDTVHAVVAFLLLFTFILAGLWLIRFALKKFTDVPPVRTVDRLTGAVLGLVQFVFLWCMIYVLLRAWPAGVFRDWVDASIWVNRTGKWMPDVMVEAVKWAQWL